LKSAGRHVLWLYFMVLAVLTAVFSYRLITAGAEANSLNADVVGFMWAPGIAGLCARLWSQGNLRGMGWGWGQTRYQMAGYLIPLVAGAIVYGSVWLSGWGGLAVAGLRENIAVLATVGVLASAVLALGEELGWRGFLVPELARRGSYTSAALISGLAWSVFHYPVLLLADYHSAAPLGYALVMFTVGVFGVSFMAAWLRLRSGSLWTAVILHASHNLFIEHVFDAMTHDHGSTEYFTTEFGAGLAVVYAAGGYWCWRRRGRCLTVV